MGVFVSTWSYMHILYLFRLVTAVAVRFVFVYTIDLEGLPARVSTTLQMSWAPGLIAFACTADVHIIWWKSSDGLVTVNKNIRTGILKQEWPKKSCKDWDLFWKFCGAKGLTLISIAIKRMASKSGIYTFFVSGHHTQAQSLLEANSQHKVQRCIPTWHVLSSAWLNSMLSQISKCTWKLHINKYTTAHPRHILTMQEILWPHGYL